MRSIGTISSHLKILNSFEANFIQKIEQWVVLDCCYIPLGQPVDGSHCCEDGLRLCSKNTALCIPHSFFINSILIFFTVFMSLQSWGSKICTPFCRCKEVCLLRFPTKKSRTLPPIHTATKCDLATKFAGKFVIFWFPLIPIHFFLINTVHCSSSVSFFSDSPWLRFGVKKLSNVQTRFWCDFLKIARWVHHAWSLKRDFRMNFKRAIKYTFHVLC